MRYDPKKIEKKWQGMWLKKKVYEPDFARAKKPFYNLMMFPYPSAEGLHIGSMRTFTGADMYGRFKRMQGHDVFEPMGLDGFGIHSENYALKVGKHPFEHARDSEKNFYRQLEAMGNSFAWNERVETYDPEYYRWTQWIFLQMFKRGLAYRKKASVNWCPSCKTVLADEQVISGECERCGTVVVKKDLEQWFFKITDYAERLLNNLEKINWPEPIKIAQRNWIGRSEGAEIEFRIQNSEFRIKVFTTRPDTLFGATYVVLGPEHQLITSNQLPIANRTEVEEYIKKARTKTDEERIADGKDPSTGSGQDKTGVEFKGIKAINPANNEELPVFVADYVLGNVGTGAIMAVPAHDERDFEFAKKFKLSIRNVLAPTFGEKRGDEFKKKSAIAIVYDPKTNRVIVLNWGPRLARTGGNMLIGGTVHEGEDIETTARREIAEETGYTDLKLIHISDVPGFGYFYSNTKNHNVFTEATGLHFELLSDKRVPVTLEDGEKEKFTVEWKPIEQVAKILDDGIHEYFFRTLMLGESYTGAGVLINSDKFDGMPSEQAKWEITKFVGGTRKVQYRLRDWLISRQRYWGPPIPIIYCLRCAENQESRIRNQELRYGIDYATFDGENFMIHPVLEKDLPVKLPHIKNFRPTGTDKSPLTTSEKFYKVKCPKCGEGAYRETDVSDTFLDSAWYYIGYLMASQKWKKGFFDVSFKGLLKKWLPVNMYIGGAEHAVLHLLYVRFVAMALRDWKYVGFEEPVKTFRTHGLITKDGAKMSKSKGNVVSPDEYISAYGSDAVRMYLAFLAPLTQGGDFRDEGIRGITRFLERTWKLFEVTNHKSQITNKTQNTNNQALRRTIHKTIKKVTEDIESFQYNTAISALMILLNEFEKVPESVTKQDFEIFLKLLAPFAPHLTEELFQQSRSGSFHSIHREPWPKYDKKLIEEHVFELIVQVNGKVRGHIKLPAGASEENARKVAMNIASVKEHISGEPRKVIFIPNKLINFVV